MAPMKTTDQPEQTFNLLDAGISELQSALSSNLITSVDLVARYLRRISIYDADGLKLSSIPILNPSVFEEAAASDARRVAGIPPRLLEGIPYLVKDNIKVKGMTVASGSPAFEDLIATEDAVCVQALRDAGAVLLGRTNMPAMANGGMQRGLYGRAESPYNATYLTAAYASGSSNGSATATAANFCAFSLGTETVSSGRSPASNNALIAYTPSRGLLPLRGVWPLYPTCDVLVPHTRSMSDLFHILDVLAVIDQSPRGDFWNEQRLISLPSVNEIRPPSYNELRDATSLRGKRFGVPSMYIGGGDDLCNRPQTRTSVIKLWKKAKGILEQCGATVVEVDFPLVTTYEAEAHNGNLVNVKGLTSKWRAIERCQLVAHVWDDFLAYNRQPGLQTLASVDPNSIFPLAPGALRGTPDTANLLKWQEMVNYPKSNEKPASVFELPGIEQSLKALENARKETLEDWMDRLGLDAVVFPANGDVGPANADVDEESSSLAWQNGVRYSNGNRPIRHLGVPTVSVPMGIMKDTKMPVNLTFAGKAYDDNNLLRYAYAFEKATRARVLPPLVPALNSDSIHGAQVSTSFSRGHTIIPHLEVQTQCKETVNTTVYLQVQGTVQLGDNETLESLSFEVNGNSIDVKVDEDNTWKVEMTYAVSDRDGEWCRWTSPALTQTMMVVVARTNTGLTAGKLLLL